MIRYDVVQGSLEWNMLRCGKPTASSFDQIVTPAKAELSKGAGRYMVRLLAERFLGYPLESVSTAAMKTGREREPEAAAWYEFTMGVETEVVGIGFTDSGRIGASPDRLVGAEGLLEIKCPEPFTHIQYLLDGGISRDYWPQLQGQMWIWNRQWLDSVSFCYRFPAGRFRVERDNGYIAKLSSAVCQFADDLNAATERLIGMGCRLPEPDEPGMVTPEAEDWLGVTMEDVDAILSNKER